MTPSLPARPGGPARPGTPPDLLVRRSVGLDPTPTSAGAARRLLREVLEGAGAQRWLEAAELACTELVSNAVLHAHTAMTVTVEVGRDELRVQVADASPVLPLQRSYDGQATTGRGMALVAALSDEHGVSDAGPQGKTVWFVLRGEPAEQSEEQLLAAWQDADWDLDDVELTDLAAPAADARSRPVTLLGMPPTLWLAAREHHDALLRELVLHLAEHDAPPVDLPATDRARAALSTAVWAAVERARDGAGAPRLPAGHPSPLPLAPAEVDLVLDVAGDEVAGFSALQDALDVAEQLAAQGRLLARPGLPEVIAVRDWACEQVVAQYAGVPPARWPGTDDERFTTARHPEQDLPAPGTVVLGVRDAERGVVAADEANRIVAVSPSLALLVGWDPADLVGRRVVTLIPARLREAHVAGFSRHLTSGEAHVLGVPLTLPVLRADGSELLCRFLIEQAAGEGGRHVYVAWVDPLPGQDEGPRASTGGV